MNKLLMLLLFVNAQAGGLYDLLSQEDILTSHSSNKKYTVSCPRPIKLKAINDNRDVHRYNAELHKYEVCIENFIRYQNKLINKSTNQIEINALKDSILQANSDLSSYDNTSDLEQNQFHSSTLQWDGLGHEDESKSKKFK